MIYASDFFCAADLRLGLIGPETIRAASALPIYVAPIRCAYRRHVFDSCRRHVFDMTIGATRSEAIMVVFSETDDSRFGLLLRCRFTLRLLGATGAKRSYGFSEPMIYASD